MSHPIVRYRLTADIVDKGVGFAIKRAIDGFFKHRGFEGQVTMVESSSNRLEAIVQISAIPNDPIIADLKEYIGKSGRLPTNHNLQPTLEITPIPCDIQEQPPIPAGQNNDIAWQKTVDSLQAQIEEKEQAISGIAEALNSRQKTIEQQRRMLGELEKKLESGQTKAHDNPIAALVAGYLVGAEETLLGANLGLSQLDSSGERQHFLRVAPKQFPSLADYVNSKFGTSFASEEEIRQAANANYSSWEQTSTARQLQEQQKRYDADAELLKSARAGGASPHIIEALEKAISDQTQEQTNVEQTIISKKREYEALKRAAEAMKANPLERTFATYNQVVQDSEERRAANCFIPLIVSRQDNRIVFIRNYIEDGPFELYLDSLIEENAKRAGLPLSAKERTIEGAAVKITYPNRPVAISEACISHTRETISFNDGLVERLGIKIQPVIVSIK